MLTVAFTPYTAAAQDGCIQPPIAGTGILAGIVTSSTGSPVAGASVEATWTEWQTAGGRLQEVAANRMTHSDSQGGFRLCGLPRGVHVSVRAEYAAGVSRRIVVSSDSLFGAPLSLAVGTGMSADPGARASSVHLKGIVRDDAGHPVVGVRISIDGLAGFTTSLESGEFDVAPLLRGDHVIRARRIGFREVAIPVRIDETTGSLELRLTAIPVQLSGVYATTTRTAFEIESGFGERRRRGPGVFFDRAELELLRPHNLTDVLRTVSGFRVETRLTRWGYQSTATMDRAAPSSIGCPIDFYVNGHEYTPTSMGIDNDVPASQIEAVEVYKPSQIPAQFFGKRSRCGAVLIWTRYRAHEIDR